MLSYLVLDAPVPPDPAIAPGRLSFCAALIPLATGRVLDFVLSGFAQGFEGGADLASQSVSLERLWRKLRLVSVQGRPAILERSDPTILAKTRS